MKTDDILSIVSRYSGKPGAVISMLEAIQAKHSYLPKEALKIVADSTGHSLVDIFGIATFYKAFTLKPRGKHLCSVCLGTACHVRGAPRIASELERELGIMAGETTPDRQFTLETVNCLGACALGPIVVVNGHYFSNVTPAKVKQIIEKAHIGFEWLEIRTDQRIFPVEVSCPSCNHSLMDRNYYIDGHPSIRVTVSFGDKHGWLRLSCLYGSYAVEFEHNIPMDTVVHFFCPHCHTELMGASNCPDCGTPMVPMFIRGGGMVQVCPRRGCKGHLLDLSESII
jgi:NADH:ubiquinone oxidoreductase subunit E